MSAVTVDLPPNLRITNRSDPHLSPVARSGGVSISGIEQVVSPLASRWRWRIIIPVLDEPTARSYRAIKARLVGRFNYLRTRICDHYSITRRDVGAWSDVDPVPHSDGAYFGDYTGYEVANPTAPIMAAAAIGATEIRIRASDLNGAMTAGVFLSINDWLYLATYFELDGSELVLTIAPPLRVAVTTDDFADFDAKAVWNLDSDDDGRHDLAVGKFGTAELSLIEAIGRAL